MMGAYGLAVDPGWLGRDDDSDRIDEACDAITSDDGLLLEAWSDWCEAHEADLIEALKALSISGDTHGMDAAVQAAVHAAACARVALLRKSS